MKLQVNMLVWDQENRSWVAAKSCKGLKIAWSFISFSWFHMVGGGTQSFNVDHMN
jgi:hypothetical protein